MISLLLRQEGKGIAYYRIGLEDHGNAHGLPLDEVKESLSALYFIARTLKAELKVDKIFKGTVGDVIEVMVRKNEIDGIKVDIKITMLGGEGAGKSTLVRLSLIYCEAWCPDIGIER